MLAPDCGARAARCLLRPSTTLPCTSGSPREEGLTAPFTTGAHRDDPRRQADLRGVDDDRHGHLDDVGPAPRRAVHGHGRLHLADAAAGGPHAGRARGRAAVRYGRAHAARRRRAALRGRRVVRTAAGGRHPRRGSDFNDYLAVAWTVLVPDRAPTTGRRSTTSASIWAPTPRRPHVSCPAARGRRSATSADARR